MIVLRYDPDCHRTLGRVCGPGRGSQAHESRVLYDDLANKAICGACADARFSLAYTGLMMTPVRTDEWLANLLAGRRMLAQPLPEVLDTLAAALTEDFERFKHLPDDQRRLTLAFAGFGRPGPFAATVSNEQEDRGRSSRGPRVGSESA